MKALSLTQPWATLVAVGAKRIETRSWGTTYRGPIAIHASKAFPRADRDLCLTNNVFFSVLKQHISRVADLPRGAVIATARLVDVVPIIKPEKTIRGVKYVSIDPDGIVRVWEPTLLAGVPGHVADIQPNEHEASFGDYTPGRYAWLLDRVVKLPEPIPARGSLGLWNWDGAP